MNYFTNGAPYLTARLFGQCHAETARLDRDQALPTWLLTNHKDSWVKAMNAFGCTCDCRVSIHYTDTAGCLQVGLQSAALTSCPYRG